MDAKQYQEAAARTECDQVAAMERMHSLMPIRLNHAVIGAMGELGELASIIEKWLYYGQLLDLVGLEEELGDALWYIALACNAVGADMGKIMEANLAKLVARYPEKYSDELAKEENRNRPVELQKMPRSSLEAWLG